VKKQEICKATEELARQLQEWRKEHKAPTRLPEEYWARAAHLATQQGIYKTARALRLDYMSLKRRVSESVQVSQGPEATFLEWLSPMSVGIAECCLKVRSAGGAKLRVRMQNVAPEFVASIIRDFAGAP
jgi:hypothetical protein